MRAHHRCKARLARLGDADLLAAERLGLDTVQCGEFALLTTEVSRNVLLHGGGGQTIISGSKQ